jgi:hypothetical protein
MTLARLFAAQGHWEKAAAMYRRLLELEPERQDIAQALSEAEQQFLTSERRHSSQDLGVLLGQWIDLMLQYDRLRKLKRFKNRL